MSSYWQRNKEHILHEYGSWNDRLKNVANFDELKDLLEEAHEQGIDVRTKRRMYQVDRFMQWKWEKVWYDVHDAKASRHSCKLENLHRSLYLCGYLNRSLSKERETACENRIPLSVEGKMRSFSGGSEEDGTFFLVPPETSLETVLDAYKRYQIVARVGSHSRVFRDVFLEAMLIAEKKGHCSVYRYSGVNIPSFGTASSVPLLFSLYRTKDGWEGRDESGKVWFTYHLTRKKLVKQGNYSQPKTFPVSKWLDEGKRAQETALTLRLKQLGMDYHFRIDMDSPSNHAKKMERLNAFEKWFLLLYSVFPITYTETLASPIPLISKSLTRVYGQYHWGAITVSTLTGVGTFIHEFAHWMDDRLDSARYTDDTYGSLMSAKALRDEIVQTIQSRSQQFSELLNMEGNKRKKYHSSDAEVFARVFADYVCLKGGKAKVLHEEKGGGLGVWMAEYWQVHLTDGSVINYRPDYPMEDVELVVPLFEKLMTCFASSVMEKSQ